MLMNAYISFLDEQIIIVSHRFILVQVCIANYIIARSMREGKGSQCQEGQGAYQESKRSS